MAEKNILAYFKSEAEAEGVAKKLQSLRVIDLSIDEISRYPGSGSDHIMNPITGDFAGLGSLTLGGDFSSRDASILAAADPSASGMSDGGNGMPTGRNILLTVVVDAESFDKAMKIIHEAGGQV